MSSFYDFVQKLTRDIARFFPTLKFPEMLNIQRHAGVFLILLVLGDDHQPVTFVKNPPAALHKGPVCTWSGQVVFIFQTPKNASDECVRTGPKALWTT